MRVPHVSERIKEAPAQALRGVFAGIGQLLLITDKIRNKPGAGQDVPRARTPRAPQTVTDSTVGVRAARTATAKPAATHKPAAATPTAAKAKPAAARTSATAAASAAAAPAAASAPPTAVTAAAAPAGSVASGKTAAADEAASDEAASGGGCAGEAAPAKPAMARRSPAKPTTPKPATPKPTAAKPGTPKPAAKAATTRHTSAKTAAAEAPAKPPKRQSTRDFDKTGNVRLLGGEADSTTLDAGPAATVAAKRTAAAAEPVTAAEPTAAAPLPNYDELSLPSLRARLRNLDVTQVRRLAEYERAHAARADVLVMFERRVAKLEAEAKLKAEA